MRLIKIERSITNRAENSLNRYLQELDKTELLTTEEEISLAKKIRAGDKAALDQLVKCNLRFVVSVAKKYQNLGLPLADLINEGNLGLMKAAKLFDETKGFKFISYAVWWIRQSMILALGTDTRMIRLPGNMITVTANIRKVSEKLEQKLERVPLASEIEEVLYVPNPILTMEYAFGRNVVSLDGPAHADGERNSDLASVLVDSNVQSPDHHLMGESFSLEIKRMLSMLHTRERVIVTESFGLTGREKTLEEIALDLGMSKERVRQLKNDALGKLRKVLNKTLGAHG